MSVAEICRLAAVPAVVGLAAGIGHRHGAASGLAEVGVKGVFDAGQDGRVGDDEAEFAVVVQGVVREVLRPEEDLGGRRAVVGDDRFGVDVEAVGRSTRSPCRRPRRLR